jgi:hypothetical protein
VPKISCAACCGMGQWEAECCNGSGGCSCCGVAVPMGACRVCGGSGMADDEADQSANVKAIQGYGFLGTGPAGGYFGCAAMGMPGRRR